MLAVGLLGPQYRLLFTGARNKDQDENAKQDLSRRQLYPSDHFEGIKSEPNFSHYSNNVFSALRKGQSQLKTMLEHLTKKMGK